jgi:hypothetical protein
MTPLPSFSLSLRLLSPSPFSSLLPLLLLVDCCLILPRAAAAAAALPLPLPLQRCLPLPFFCRRPLAATVNAVLPSMMPLPSFSLLLTLLSALPFPS